MHGRCRCSAAGLEAALLLCLRLSQLCIKTGALKMRPATAAALVVQRSMRDSCTTSYCPRCLMSALAALAASSLSNCHMGWAKLSDTLKLAEQLFPGLAYVSTALTRMTCVHSIRPVAVMLSCFYILHPPASTSVHGPICCPGCLQGPNGPVAQAVLAWQDTLSPRSKGSSRRGSLMVRELTLHQLRALIEDVYTSKRRADAR